MLRQQQAAYTHDTANYERRAYYWEARATYAALADELDSAAVYYRRQPGYGGARPVPAGAALAAQPATATILAATRHRQLVLFNEEHTQPRGRWLVGSLLPALYRQGFRYLALEALNTDDSAGVRRRGYPVASSGFYTNEPHFGNLIRQACTLGFRVVGYDAASSDRERDQARNLLAATLKNDPQARVVALAGHGHIDEQPTGPVKHMARWLHELSGIDPLTIDQTQLAVWPLPGLPALPTGAYVVPQANARLPAYLQADMYVLNKLNLAEAGNSFGQRAGRLAPIPVPPDSLRPGLPRVVLVYHQAEFLAQPNPQPVAVRGAGMARPRPASACYPAATESSCATHPAASAGNKP
ncbi:MAG: hypothetical protein WKG07_43530 [Hymenobacter sp.]